VMKMEHITIVATRARDSCVSCVLVTGYGARKVG
jgi:hypothetical protein